MTARAIPHHVIKRDGTTVRFDRSKIESAVRRAALEVLQDPKRAQSICQQVAGAIVERIARQLSGQEPSVEQIQDVVEAVLMSEGYGRIAKSYILYRERRTAVRFAKTALGLKDDLKLPLNTMEVLKNRYLLKDERQNIIETPSELFRRVAHHVARAEENFKSDPAAAEVEETFYQMMRNLEFMPNSPTLMNAGTRLGQLSACFVIPVPDSIEGIFEALSDMAKIHQSGGGTGFSFSNLRPRGDLVSSTKGRASGPISFMSIFDQATSVIVQGGRRRGANMGILRCDHPDIVDFIEAKAEPGKFTNFNLSVGVTDKFMRKVQDGGSFPLINPHTGKTAGTAKARALFDLLVNAAWRTGDPGMVFLDQINRHNPTPDLGRIEATNPCGELPLLPYESCNLGSINLARMISSDGSSQRGSNGRVNWQKLRETIHWAVRFLDDVVEVNSYPLEQVRRISLANRKIGLGVMGFADMLTMLAIPYNASAAVAFADRLMGFVHRESLAASAALAVKRGVFPHFARSIYAKRNLRIRNATVNTVAPSGSISIIAGCSSGIEPLFAVAFVRNVMSGTRLFEVNPIFEAAARRRGVYSHELLAEIARLGSLSSIKAVPKDLKRIFVTAFDVTPRQHLEIQAAFQRHTDNAVSKTINLPAEGTVEDVRDVYLAAHALRCKGITIYRYGSKAEQVLSFAQAPAGNPSAPRSPVTADCDYAGGCLTGDCLC